MSVRADEVLKAVALASSPVSALLGTRWYKGYKPGEMTFRYDLMHGWE